MKYRSTSLDIFTWPFTTCNTYICAFSAKWSNNMKTMACKFLHFLAVQTNHSWESTPSCDGSLGQSTWRSWSRRILGHRPLLRPLLIKLNGGRYFGPMEKIYPRVNSHIYGKLMVSLGKSSTFMVDFSHSSVDVGPRRGPGAPIQFFSEFDPAMPRRFRTTTFL